MANTIDGFYLDYYDDDGYLDLVVTGMAETDASYFVLEFDIND